MKFHVVKYMSCNTSNNINEYCNLICLDDITFITFEIN